MQSRMGESRKMANSGNTQILKQQQAGVRKANGDPNEFELRASVEIPRE